MRHCTYIAMGQKVLKRHAQSRKKLVLDRGVRRNESSAYMLLYTREKFKPCVMNELIAVVK